MTATRENSANSDGGQQGPLFSLPNGESASFLLHNFENADITMRIIAHGGRVTDDDSAADVILTIRPDEYKYLKDKYAISRKTHVRMSGFVDRCINSRRFQLAPVVEKGVPGRRIGSRRTEFTEEDDEYLCQYMADVLPDKGGRTGHFIYADLIRRADEFNQYTWAHRHPKDAWRERYRKNQERLDNRIAEIVEGNPPAPDGKGQYKYRRYGKIEQDAELIAGNDDLVELGAEEGGDSATDDEGGTVQTKRLNAQPQEEEEEEEEEGHFIVHQPGAISNPRNKDAESLEEAEEQITEPEPETGPRTRAATRRGGVSPREARTPKRRRTKHAKQVVEEPVSDNPATLRRTEIDDKVAEEPGPFPGAPEQPNSPGVVPEAMQPESGRRKRRRPEARPIVRSLSPRRTRAGSKVRSVNPRDAAPAVSQATPRKSKTSATVAATVPRPIHESQVSDEFAAYSDDEGDMHEVEANLQVSAVSPGVMQSGSLADTQMHSPGTDDLQTSPRVQTALSDDDAIADPDSSEDDTDAKLFALVRRLDVTARPQPPPGPKASLSKGDDDLDRTSSEAVFPSLGTRASAEKRRRTQAAKVMPYVPPRGTRAASMMEHERAQEAPVRAKVTRL